MGGQEGFDPNQSGGGSTPSAATPNLGGGRRPSIGGPGGGPGMRPGGLPRGLPGGGGR